MHKMILLLACLIPGPLSSVLLGADKAAEPSTGSVAGRVKYAADPERVWRFSRYYVKDSEKGWLAEAVIALEGKLPKTPGVSREARTNTIDQVNFQFIPETVAIHAGDSVRFLNSEETIHNVMTTDGTRPFNVNVVKDTEYVHAFDAAGRLDKPIRIGCVFHGGMRAWIYVFDHPWFQVTGPDGEFRLEQVPAGEYMLAMIHPAGRLRWKKPVVVAPGQSAEVEILVSPDDLIGLQ